ncbi:MAG: hypothetical protein IT376_20590 [Polyangiaceae bacterium]|nr:hypothetical protein [Polyangiaceae bacterium]
MIRRATPAPRRSWWCGPRAPGALGIGALLALACAPGPQPCVTPGTCPTGEECLANRCVASGGEPVAPGARRVVLAPVELAVIREGRALRGLPLAVTFGRAGAPREALLLGFGGELRRDGELEAAFLVLEPVEGEPSAEDVPVRVSRVLERWRPGEVGGRRAPAAGEPSARGVARTRPALPLRVDVTAIVRRWRADPHGAAGVVVRADAESPDGATYALGSGRGRAPYLELYLR